MAHIRLTAEQEKVINTRGADLQVIACAGSGKTESISRRVAALINDGEAPDSIVAFTFTERAAIELKERIYRRVEEVKGKDFLGRLGSMFVGTIHGYCFRLLKFHVPKYGNYDVLDENRHAGLLSREYRGLGLNKLGRSHWQPIRDFAKAVDIIGNELIDVKRFEGSPFGECYVSYLEMLERYHFLTFSLIISKAVEMLGDQEIFTRVHSPLKHLIVDEYQDINPAQERLIELLSLAPVQLCVVGDDDQSIYQWRGADVSNILKFSSKRPSAKTVKLESNRRSLPTIVKKANDFACSIPYRLNKEMQSTRSPAEIEFVTWKAPTEGKEAEKVAETILKLHDENGFQYRDIAVLYRSVRTSAPALITALEERKIPFSCAGRTGLFLQHEISLMGEILVWFIGGDWKDERFGTARPADLNHIVADLSHYFGKDGNEIPGLRKYLEDWRSFRMQSNRPVSLVGDFYRLLDFLGASKIDIAKPEGSARFGAYARFSQVLADFEHVTRRGRYIDEDGRRIFRGGRDRGKPYYQMLANYLLHYARDAYEDFEGEQITDLDSVNILTVHQAKGLEWPVVFLPGLTSMRFPSSKSGQAQQWMLPDSVFPQELRMRYEGGDSDERRLFYVALTRAKDLAYLSYFERITRATKPSPYLVELVESKEKIIPFGSLPVPNARKDTDKQRASTLEIGFSDIANYEECGFRYRLGRIFGFQVEIAAELGYGKALHHVLRHVAELARRSRRIPTAKELDQILANEFYLPFADNPTFDRMHRAADLLIGSYVNNYSEDLNRVWETERPFEVSLEDGILSGQADIILDKEDGSEGRLAIVDYKTATDPLRDERYHLQLAVYAAAARGEGLDVMAGYLHELSNGLRHNVDVGEKTASNSLESVGKAMKGIRSGQFQPCTEKDYCEKCDYNMVCRHSRADNHFKTCEPETPIDDSGVQGYVMNRLLNSGQPKKKTS